LRITAKIQFHERRLTVTQIRGAGARITVLLGMTELYDTCTTRWRRTYLSSSRTPSGNPGSSIGARYLLPRKFIAPRLTGYRLKAGMTRWWRNVEYRHYQRTLAEYSCDYQSLTSHIRHLRNTAAIRKYQTHIFVVIPDAIRRSGIQHRSKVFTTAEIYCTEVDWIPA
jgi:hypothetical protein